VVIDGWTITVASVGDSKCVLDSQGVVSDLTVDHRLDCNEEEYDYKLPDPFSVILFV
jgi:serine/threonine protein phosphatase PrpC